MIWGLVGVGMRSTSWMRPGSPGRHLEICLLGVVFLIVFVRHLFLGDLFLLFFFFFSGWFYILFLVWVFVGSPFSFVIFYYMITVSFGSWVLVVLYGFLVGFLLGKAGFLCLFVVISSLVLYLLFFGYTELLSGWLTSDALLTRC